MEAVDRTDGGVDQAVVVLGRSLAVRSPWNPFGRCSASALSARPRPRLSRRTCECGLVESKPSTPPSSNWRRQTQWTCRADAVTVALAATLPLTSSTWRSTTIFVLLGVRSLVMTWGLPLIRRSHATPPSGLTELAGGRAYLVVQQPPIRFLIAEATNSGSCSGSQCDAPSTIASS